jgi:allophanate hydrolase
MSLSSLSLDFRSLSHAYKEGTITPSSLVDEIHRRLAQRAGDNVWTHVVPHDDALAAARRIERPRERRTHLPLYGIPFGVKDNIDVAGLPTTAGCPAFGYLAERTAPLVTRLQEAGAILIGKQNMDHFATGLVGIRSLTGYCRNAFDERYIPGGSSSGSAVAVATGQVAFSIGSDTGGSGRVPAALNNIVGFKPTPGAISTEGFLYCNRTFDVPPVFALTVDDAGKVFEVLTQRDIRADHSGLARNDAADAALDAFRFGVPQDDELCFFGDHDAHAHYLSVVGMLEKLGGQAVRIDYAPFVEAGKLVFGSALVAERWITYGDFALTHRDDVHPAVFEAVAAAREYDAADTFRALYRRQALTDHAARVFTEIDVLALPTAGTIYQCDEVERDPVKLNANMGYYTYFANPLGLAAVSVPAGFTNRNLPFGLSLVGAAWSEKKLLALASRVERHLAAPLGATGLRSRWYQ